MPKITTPPPNRGESSHITWPNGEPQKVRDAAEVIQQAVVIVEDADKRGK